MKTVRAILGTLMALGLFAVPTVSAQPFSDVPDTHQYADAIAYVKDNGIVNGYADGTFRPDQKVNRAELLKILMESNYEGPFTGSNCFNDVQNQWFAGYICHAHTRRIIAGYSDGGFHPGDMIIFSEAAKMITQSFTCDWNNTRKPYLNNFGLISFDQDTPLIVHDYGCPVGNNTSLPWYAIYVEGLERSNAIPLSVTAFNHQMTRGEIAEIIYRVHNIVRHKPSQTYASIEQQNSALSYPGSIPPTMTKNDLIGTWSVVGSNDKISIVELPDDTLYMTHFGPITLHGHVARGKAPTVQREGIEEIMILRNPNNNELQFFSTIPDRRWDLLWDMFPFETQPIDVKKDFEQLMDYGPLFMTIKFRGSSNYTFPHVPNGDCISPGTYIWEYTSEYYSNMTNKKRTSMALSVPMLPPAYSGMTLCNNHMGYYYQSVSNGDSYFLAAPANNTTETKANARFSEVQGLKTIDDLFSYCPDPSSTAPLNVYIDAKNMDLFTMCD